MNDYMEKIAEQAFDDELQKIAAETSELVGTMLGMPVSIPAGIIGYLMGKKTEAEMKEQDDAGISNILLGGLGLPAYRLGRRMASAPKE